VQLRRKRVGRKWDFISGQFLRDEEIINYPNLTPDLVKEVLN